MVSKSQERAAVFPRKPDSVGTPNPDLGAPNTVCISPLMRPLPHIFRRKTLNGAMGDSPNYNLSQTSWLWCEVTGRLGPCGRAAWWPPVMSAELPLIKAIPCTMSLTWNGAEKTFWAWYVSGLFWELSDKTHGKVLWVRTWHILSIQYIISISDCAR